VYDNIAEGKGDSYVVLSESQVTPVSPEGAEVVEASEEKAATIEIEGKAVPTKPGDVVSVPTKEIGVDPEAFQYKLDTSGPEGVTEKFKDITEWNAQAAGTVLLWEDNAGKLWVVDGHHRVELANRLGVENVNAFVVREADGISKAQARVMGAMSNLANERGTAVDAAKLFRDSDISLETLQKQGIPISSAVVRQGLDMKNLSDEVFRMVIDEKIPANMAAQIGRYVTDPVQQKQVANIIAEGGISNIREAELLAKTIDSAPILSKTEQTLFGAETTQKSLYAERAKVLASVESKLKTNAKVFGILSKQAGLIEKAGNVLAPKTNKEIQDRAKEILFLLEKLVNVKGPVSEALNDATKQYAENPTKQKLSEVSKSLIDKWQKELSIESVGKVPVKVSEPDKPQVGLFEKAKPKEPTTFGGAKDVTGILGGMPQEPLVGLTKAESEYLGTRAKRALKAAQKMGLPVGYKKGYQVAMEEGRRILAAARLTKMIGDTARKDIVALVKLVVPKEEQGRYLNRLAKLGSEAKAETTERNKRKLIAAIEKFVDAYEKKRLVKDFHKFVKKVQKDYRLGEIKLGKMNQPARKAFEQVLSDYTFAKLSEAKAEELAQHLEHIQRVAGSIAQAYKDWESIDPKEGTDIYQLPNRRIEALEALSKTNVKELDTKQIQFIFDELKSLLTNEQRKTEIRKRIRGEEGGLLIRVFGKTYRIGIPSKSISNYITDSRSELHDRETTAKGEVQEPGILGKVLGVAQGNLRTLVRRMGGKDAKAMEEFLVDRVYASRRLRDAIYKDMYLKAIKGFESLGLDSAFLKEYYNAEVDVVVGGKTYTIPKRYLLNFWLDANADGNLKREIGASEHTLYSKNGKLISMDKMSLDELQTIAEQVPDLYKKITDFIFQFNKENNAPLLNAVSIWERGYPLAQAENYWSFPRKIDRVSQGKKAIVELAADNRGRYMPRVGGTQTHRMEDPLMTFINGMQQDAEYASMSLVLQDAKALLGDSLWRQRVRKTGNDSLVQAIITLYQRAQGLVTDSDIADYLAGKYLGTFGKGTLSMRPTGGFIQTASKSAAFPVIEREYFNRTYIPSQADVDALMDLDPTMYWRWEARHFDYVIGAASARDILHRAITGKPFLKDALLRHYTKGDQWAVLKIWEAAKEKIRRTTNLKDGSDGFTQASLDLFHRAMESQPQWDTWHRSVFTSEYTPFKRSFAMFMSARNAQHNVLLQAGDDIEKGRISKKEGAKRIGNIVEANFKVSLYRRLFRKLIKYGVLAALFGLGKRDEEDITEHVKKDMRLEAEKVPTETVLNMIGLPVYGQIPAFLADLAIKRLQGKPTALEYGEPRTGSPLGDFIINVEQATDKGFEFFRHVGLAMADHPDGFYKAGSKKGEPRWKTSGVEFTNEMLEITSQLTGYGYSGPMSDIYWPAKSVTTDKKKKRR
jgi:hypothetical protein